MTHNLCMVRVLNHIKKMSSTTTAGQALFGVGLFFIILEGLWLMFGQPFNDPYTENRNRKLILWGFVLWFIFVIVGIILWAI